jgi:uncharacterized protein involved in copper resistance
MLTVIAAIAAAAAQPAQPASPAGSDAKPMQMGQMQGMDVSKMDHSTMDHSKMDHSAMSKDDKSCCHPGKDGKMECSMLSKGSDSSHQGHSGH